MSKITDAEWQIMRLIWAEENVISATLISELQKTKNWSPTTVKTLLARLVKKEIIGYEMEGRTRKYKALLSEIECVKNEMNNVIHRLYGGNVNRQTKHFVFYGNNDTKYIDLISKELEGSYERILESLECELDEKIMVYTHKTKAQLQSALGVSNGPEWLRGGMAWGVLHLAPKESFKDISAERVAVHVFAQIAIDRINRNVPYWLFQGCSAYLAGWLVEERVAGAIKKHFNNLSENMLSEIGSDFERFRDGMGYELSYTVAEFISIKFGYGKLAGFIRKPGAYEDIFGCTKLEFQKKWIEFIKARYLEE